MVRVLPGRHAGLLPSREPYVRLPALSGQSGRLLAGPLRPSVCSPLSGIHPASGYRSTGSGAFSAVGSRGYSWSVHPATGVGAYFLSLGSNYLNPGSYDNRAYAFPIRCVRAFTGPCRVVSCFRRPPRRRRSVERARDHRAVLVRVRCGFCPRVLPRFPFAPHVSRQYRPTWLRLSSPLRPSVCSSLPPGMILLPATATACPELTTTSAGQAFPGPAPA